MYIKIQKYRKYLEKAAMTVTGLLMLRLVIPASSFAAGSAGRIPGGKAKADLNNPFMPYLWAGLSVLMAVFLVLFLFYFVNGYRKMTAASGNRRALEEGEMGRGGTQAVMGAVGAGLMIAGLAVFINQLLNSLSL